MAAGFYWGANNPYLRPVWFKVRRAPKGLNPTFALIGEDANPAYIIYECMTNRDWGMGTSPVAFDVDTFEGCGETLFNEEFGLSMIWTRQATIEAFVTEVLDHIQATLFVNPRTGLITLKLLRNDYDIETLPVISPSNAKLTNLQRKAWGETANEVVVTWTNPTTEKEETVAAHDLANVAQQGSIISNSKNYYAIRKKELAARVAERDLRTTSQPLATADVEGLRVMWDVLPGQVFVLTWPEKNIEQLIVRAGAVNYGKPGDSHVRFPVYEDVFGIGAAQYLEAPDTDWEDPAEDPSPLSFEMALTAPAFLTAPALALSSPSDIEYPEAITLVLAAADSPDDINFELIGETVQPNGVIVFTSFGTRQFVGGAMLHAAIPAEIETFIATFDAPTGASPLAGEVVIIGYGEDDDTEIALVKTVTELGWTLSRGVLDTVPRAWPAGTRIWAIGTGLVLTDTTLRSDGETVEYRLLTRTSKGLLDFEDATPLTLTLTGRPHLPNRPANVSVDTVKFGSVTGLNKTNLAIEWQNRNRLLETSQILDWDDGSVTPEVGQTTTVIVMAADRTVLATHDGLTGTTYSLATSDFGGRSTGIVRVTAKRDGLESLQGHEILVTGMLLVYLNMLTNVYRNAAASSVTLGALTGWNMTQAATTFALKLDGTLQTFAANVARDTDRGLLLEVARTNNTTYSQDFGNAAWAKTPAGTGVAPVVSGSLVTAPDGTSTARSVAFNRGATNTAGNSSLLAKTDTGLTSGQTYSRSVWLRSATPAVYLFRRVGGGYQVCNVTATWQRFSHAGVAAATTEAFQIGLVGGQGSAQTGTLEIWQAQTELGATASSEIPTTTVAVTRAADAASLTVAAGLSNDTLTVTHELGGVAVATTLDRSAFASPTVVNLGATSAGAWLGRYIQRVEFER